MYYLLCIESSYDSRMAQIKSGTYYTAEAKGRVFYWNYTDFEWERKAFKELTPLEAALAIMKKHKFISLP